MFARLALATTTLAALFSVATADLQVLSPDADHWWVAKSQNIISWTCNDSPVQSFTILVANKDINVLAAPIAVVAIENNFDCSTIITQDQASQAAGLGYTILLANPLNNTDVYATSQEFEIKALGSAYPTSTVSIPSPTGSAPSNSTTSGTASGSNAPAATPTGAASDLKTSAGFAIAAIGAVLGLVAA